MNKLINMLQKTNKILSNFSNFLDAQGFAEHEGFRAQTNNVEVIAWPKFVENSQELLATMNVWSYNIKIVNKSSRVVKLRSRYFRIVDDKGIVKEVEGEGVIGKQPEILPNDFFEYQSSVNLEADSAIMGGHYVMEYVDDKEKFLVNIPSFSLDVPANDYILN